MNYFEQESERLRFRKLTMDDVESWEGFFDNNESLPYMGLDLSRGKQALAHEWILKQLERYETQGLGHLAIIEKASGAFIGMAGILPREVDEKPFHEVAYSLKPAFWGKGYGTESASQMKAFGLNNNIDKQFVSIIDKRNHASIHVAEKNGMTALFETHYLGMDVAVYGTGK